MSRQTRIANLVLDILLTVEEDKEAFAEAAAERGITLHQLIAAAIAEAVVEEVRKAATRRR
jgi:hypothetical protein